MASPGNLATPVWILASIFAICGTLSLVAAILNWDWFFDTLSARMLAAGPRSRTFARIVYGFFGAAIILAAITLPLME